MLLIFGRMFLLFLVLQLFKAGGGVPIQTNVVKKLQDLVILFRGHKMKKTESHLKAMKVITIEDSKYMSD